MAFPESTRSVYNTSRPSTTSIDWGNAPDHLTTIADYERRNVAPDRSSDIDLAGLPTIPAVTNPTNLNPFGGVRTGGGGGGGGETTIDYSPWGGWAAQAKPGMYQTGTPLNYGQYTGIDMYDWDPSMYDTARTGVQTGVADSRKRQNTAFDLAMQQYLNYQDPYASGPREYNPGVDPRLMASMAAWGGAGSNQAAQTYGEGVQADAAMGSVYDLLSKVGSQYNADNLAAVGGDRMQASQALDALANELGLGVDLAQARGYSDWRDKDWQNRASIYDKNFGYGAQATQANWDRGNTVADQNVATTNQWNQGVVDTILQMILGGGKNIPAPGNDLSKLITLPQYQA